MDSLSFIGISMKYIFYIGAVVAMVLGAVPLFLFWRQEQSGRMGYHQYAYHDYDAIMSVGILVGGVLGGAVVLWIARRK